MRSSLFKEVRNLLWLGFQVPHTINNTAKDAKRVYPHAVCALLSFTLTILDNLQGVFDGICSNLFADC